MPMDVDKYYEALFADSQMWSPYNYPEVDSGEPPEDRHRMIQVGPPLKNL